jgi:hypothetical protein
VDVPELRAALAATPPSAWSQPSTIAGTGVHHGYRRCSLRGAAAVPWSAILDRFAPVRDAWLSWIDPGGFILEHCDRGPFYERWQVPVATAGTTTQDGLTEASEDGVPFRVRHWLPHSVANPTDRPRIHVVIDRDVLVDPSRSPLTVTGRDIDAPRCAP